MLKFRRKVAFTLIELLMIIIIIAVVSALVVPAYARYWSKAKFESSVHQIEEMLSDARDKAVELDTTTTVSFNKQSQTFMVMRLLPPAQNDQPSIMSAADQQSDLMSQNVVPTTVSLGGNISVTQFQAGGFSSSPTNSTAGVSSSEVHFHGDGSSDGAHLSLTNSSGNTADLTIWPANGRLTREDL